MRTTENRTAKYNAKYDPQTVGLKVAARLELMRDAYAAFANSMEQCENETRYVLNSETTAVPRMDYAFYLAFSREVWKAATWEGYGGKTLEKIATDLADKWEDRGLTRTILVKICDQVHHITIT
jgi:hypothetical protein